MKRKINYLEFMGKLMKTHPDFVVLVHSDMDGSVLGGWSISSAALGVCEDDNNTCDVQGIPQ